MHSPCPKTWTNKGPKILDGKGKNIVVCVDENVPYEHEGSSRCNIASSNPPFVETKMK
jgi:hypothetical protein